MLLATKDKDYNATRVGSPFIAWAIEHTYMYMCRGFESHPSSAFFLFGEKRVVWVSCLPLFSIYRKEFSCVLNVTLYSKRAIQCYIHDDVYVMPYSTFLLVEENLHISHFCGNRLFPARANYQSVGGVITSVTYWDKKVT